MTVIVGSLCKLVSTQVVDCPLNCGWTGMACEATAHGVRAHDGTVEADWWMSLQEEFVVRISDMEVD